MLKYLSLNFVICRLNIFLGLTTILVLYRGHKFKRNNQVKFNLI